MVITEAELRELWRDGKNPLPRFPPGTRFSPAAQDFLKAHKLEIRFESAPSSNSQLQTSNFKSPISKPEWDKPGSFPVVLTGPVPVCAVCGQLVPHKPDHLTQLDAGRFAPKTHPRIRLRGRLDSLHALVMLAAAEARRYQLPRLAEGLDTLAAYCREIQSAEYHTRPVRALAVLGKSEDEIHEISHWPDKHLGIAHLVPGAEDHVILHWLNVARTQTREVEVFALETSAAPELVHALNRLSSAVYYLELLLKVGQLSWHVP
jgi:ethanolamine utilization cobalamin adenosyltransferase